MINPDWLKAQIAVYAEHKGEIYDGYARFLDSVLREFCRRYAPLAIVQARAKAIVSFSEKAALKAAKYDEDPIYQMTDLCGARVILQTREEVEGVCRFVRQVFDIDDKNSVDARSRLKSDQFGYSGFHLIVQVKENQSDILGIAVPEALQRSIREDRFQRPKAEIQVRTIAEHAWADTFHDRIYKTAVQVPETYKREAARIAAVLEDVDGNTGSLASHLDAYTGHYTAYMTEDDIRNRISILQAILECEEKPEQRAALALRMARMAASLGDDGRMVEMLREYEQAAPPVGDAIRLAYGAALCRSNPSACDHGRDLLKGIEMNEGCPKPLRAAAADDLARTWASIPGHERDALDCFQKALRHAPENPYYLASFLEYEAYITRSAGIPLGLAPVLENAISVCQDHIRVGIELPRAYTAMGRLHLLRGQADESLCAYVKAVDFCRIHESSTFNSTIDAELLFLSRINFGRTLPPEHERVRGFLLLAKALHGDETALGEISRLSVRREQPKLPVLTLVGGAALMPRDGLKGFENMLMEALGDFSGTVICGGTKEGIPGVLGAIVARLKKENGCPFEAIGYLPRMIPSDAQKDDENYSLHYTQGDGFSPSEPLQGWIDLVAAGVKPENVQVLGYDGGQIAALEYRIALALGAHVGVISDSGREAAGLLKDEEWKNSANLLALPADPATVRAFVNSARQHLDAPELTEMAKAFHANYVKEKSKTISLPDNMKPWDELQETYRTANIEQARYCIAILRTCGFGVRPAADGQNPTLFSGFTDDEIEKMAELEHGRWNVERMREGWRYGQVRDDSRKIHPSLVPWRSRELPDEIKKYDRLAVCAFPEILAGAGLEVFRVK